MINETILANVKRAPLVDSGRLFVVHILHFFAAMRI